MTEVTQRCPCCDQHLPPDSYAPSMRGRTGAYCRPCRAEYQRNYKRELREIARRYAEASPVVFIEAPRLRKPRRPVSNTYRAAHQRAIRTRGLASTYWCDHCGYRADHWAYDHADPNALSGTVRSGSGQTKRCEWSIDPQHYIPLCRSCHARFDVNAPRRDDVAGNIGAQRIA